ncbi:MAG: hypothetical protein U5K38_02850 [Woeseiaceae bacterium]|nr:hypothetical protein [Woeseiaceae bacterium]
MMKSSMISIGILTLLLSAAAQSSDELQAVVMEEQKAFKEGDCEKGGISDRKGNHFLCQ